MHKTPPVSFGPVLCSSVVLTMVYAGLCSIWAIWTFCTVRFRTIEEAAASTQPFRILGADYYSWVTLADGALVAFLLWEGWSARQQPRTTRRALWAGVIMALVVVGAVQLGGHYAHAPIPGR